MDTDLAARYDRAADEIARADALLIGAGAGLGVDSGLPDFRGNEGFWKAYPPFRGMEFASVSNPRWFASDPQQAWGFFGHRLNLYRHTTPHAGFAILRRWAAARPAGAFVFTSNVDGQFQKAGFSEDQVFECHGSIHHLQCVQPCSQAIWSAADTSVTVDPATIRATSELPRCRRCQALARPNILMFGDGSWLDDRANEQYGRYQHWLNGIQDKHIVALELGAGLAIPTVRKQCERQGHFLVRVNPREADVEGAAIGLPVGALEALREIDDRLQGRRSRPGR